VRIDLHPVDLRISGAAAALRRLRRHPDHAATPTGDGGGDRGPCGGVSTSR
jgi:hypothetical protein